MGKHEDVEDVSLTTLERPTAQPAVLVTDVVDYAAA